jgi:hypothetical protein
VIPGTEVKVVAVPLGINVYDVVETCVFGRRLDVIRLEHGVNKCLRFLFQVCLYALWHFGFGGFGWAIDPAFLSFGHSFSPMKLN